MTIHEFSDAFDIALSSYQSTANYNKPFVFVKLCNKTNC